MHNVKPFIRVGLWISAVSIAVMLAVVPQKYIPEQVAHFVAATGRFAGRPISLTPKVSLIPKGRGALVSASIRIRMDRGICRVSLQQGDKRQELFEISRGQINCRIPTDSELILDPQGNTGDYDVTIGPWWHPLSPRNRRPVFLSLAIVVIIVSIFAGRLWPQPRELGRQRVCFLAAVIALSGLILYPAAHESGHMIVGTLFGATPDWDSATLTCLGGAEPHSSFKSLPATAVPFTTAGGTIVPTLIAVLLLVLWRFIHKHAWWHVSAMLVVISVHFFSCTLGCLFELYQNSHMDAISVHFGLTGPIRIAVSLSPLIVALAACVWLGMRFRESELAKGQFGKAGTEEHG